MELKGERTLDASRQVAWDALNDVDVLRGCVPGCESIVATGENQFELAVTSAIGPVKARFKGRLELADIDAPNGYTIRFEGSGGPAGFAKGDARVALAALSATQTQLSYVANTQVGGKLAQIGSRLIEAAAGATADRFFEAFGAQLAARNANQPGSTAPAAPVKLGIWSLLGAFFRRLFRRG